MYSLSQGELKSFNSARNNPAWIMSVLPTSSPPTPNPEHPPAQFGSGLQWNPARLGRNKTPAILRRLVKLQQMVRAHASVYIRREAHLSSRMLNWLCGKCPTCVFLREECEHPNCLPRLSLTELTHLSYRNLYYQKRMSFSFTRRVYGTDLL